MLYTMYDTICYTILYTILYFILYTILLSTQYITAYTTILHYYTTLLDCAGSYNLDMSTPYERAILLALLRCSAKDPNIHIRSLEMPNDTNTTSTRNSNNYELYTVQYETIKNDQFNEELKKEIELLTHFSTAAEYSYEYILQICKVCLITLYFMWVYLNILCIFCGVFSIFECFIV